MGLSSKKKKKTGVKRGIKWAYCYPVIILEMLLFLWCWAIRQSKQTAIVQTQLQMSRSTSWNRKKKTIFPSLDDSDRRIIQRQIYIYLSLYMTLDILHLNGNIWGMAKNWPLAILERSAEGTKCRLKLITGHPDWLWLWFVLLSVLLLLRPQDD